MFLDSQEYLSSPEPEPHFSYLQNQEIISASSYKHVERIQISLCLTKKDVLNKHEFFI